MPLYVMDLQSSVLRDGILSVHGYKDNSRGVGEQLRLQSFGGALAAARAFSGSQQNHTEPSAAPSRTTQNHCPSCVSSPLCPLLCPLLCVLSSVLSSVSSPLSSPLCPLLCVLSSVSPSLCPLLCASADS